MSRRRRPDADPTSLPATRIDGTMLVNLLDGLVQRMRLTERDAAIIRLRYGLEDGIPRTWDEIGKVYGVTRERIRQLEARASEKLRTSDAAEFLAERDAEGRFYGTVDVRRRRDPAQTDEQLGIIRCPTCGRRFHPGTPSWSGTSSYYSRSGRPRKYCSNKCRQAAYRARRAGRAVDPK